MAKRSRRGKKKHKIIKQAIKHKNKVKGPDKKVLVVVYDNKRQHGDDHKLDLPDNKSFKGFYYSEPIYKLVEKYKDAALLKDGNTSILLEVYEIDESDLEDVDTSFQYNQQYAENPLTMYYNYYLREKIDTPYGEAYIYFFNEEGMNVTNSEIIHSGDWISFKNEKKLKIKT